MQALKAKVQKARRRQYDELLGFVDRHAAAEGGDWEPGLFGVRLEHDCGTKGCAILAGRNHPYDPTAGPDQETETPCGDVTGRRERYDGLSCARVGWLFLLGPPFGPPMSLGAALMALKWTAGSMRRHRKKCSPLPIQRRRASR